MSSSVAVSFALDTTNSRYTKVNVAELSKKPKSLDHVQSASLGLSWLCAWIAVEHSSTTKPGDKVLVIGMCFSAFRLASLLSQSLSQAREVELDPQSPNY